MVYGKKSRDGLVPQRLYALLPKKLHNGRRVWLQQYWRVQIGICFIGIRKGEMGEGLIDPEKWGLFTTESEALGMASEEIMPKIPSFSKSLMPDNRTP